jgi:hypothetical protein
MVFLLDVAARRIDWSALGIQRLFHAAWHRLFGAIPATTPAGPNAGVAILRKVRQSSAEQRQSEKTIPPTDPARINAPLPPASSSPQSPMNPAAIDQSTRTTSTPQDRMSRLAQAKRRANRNG